MSHFGKVDVCLTVDGTYKYSGHENPKNVPPKKWTLCSAFKK